MDRLSEENRDARQTALCAVSSVPTVSALSALYSVSTDMLVSLCCRSADAGSGSDGRAAGSAGSVQLLSGACAQHELNVCRCGKQFERACRSVEQLVGGASRGLQFVRSGRRELQLFRSFARGELQLFEHGYAGQLQLLRGRGEQQQRLQLFVLIQPATDRPVHRDAD